MVDTPFIPEDAATRPLRVPSRGHIGLVVPGGIASGLVAGLAQGQRGGWGGVWAPGDRCRRPGSSSVVDRQASRGVRS